MEILFVLVAVVAIGTLLAKSNVFESEKQRSERLISERRQQAEKRGIEKMASNIARDLGQQNGGRWEYEDEQVKVTHLLCGSGDDSFLSTDVIMKTPQGEEQVFSIIDLSINCYIPGNWEDHLRDLQPKAKQAAESKACREREEQNRRFGI